MIDNNSCWWDGYNTAKKLFERPHGKWIENLDSRNDEMQASCYCSECGASCYCATDKFCHECGADMRENSEPIQRKFNGCRRGECKDCVDKNTCKFSGVRGDNDLLEEDAKQASIPYSYQMPKNYIKYKLDYLYHDSVTKSDTQI